MLRRKWMNRRVGTGGSNATGVPRTGNGKGRGDRYSNLHFHSISTRAFRAFQGRSAGRGLPVQSVAKWSE